MSGNEQMVSCYHGTTRENGEKIKKERNFRESNRKNEWLGKGTYFLQVKKMPYGGLITLGLLGWKWKCCNVV